MEINDPKNQNYGPHGGIWLKMENGYIEITIFELGVPPRFRLYFYDFDGKYAVLPLPNNITLETIRSDDQRQLFTFDKKIGYLEASSELPEPHEFSVRINFNHEGHTHTYNTQFSEEDHGSEGHNQEHTEHSDHGHDHTPSKGILGWLKGKFAHSHSIAEKIDTEMESNKRGIQTLKTTLVILSITAIFQLIIVAISGSVALLADTIHNFADAGTSLPLWLAFALVSRGANRRYTYGYGKFEDVAGVLIVLIIFFSACIAAYESIIKLIHPMPVTNIGWVVLAAILGFIGNEWVAIYRIRVGKEIGSAALIADGYHARVDGFTSLAVLFSALGVWLGIPIIDPLVGLGITLAILFIVKDAAKSIWIRLIDGIEPEILKEIEHAPMHVAGVQTVREVRARWLGHRVYADVIIEVDKGLSLSEADELTQTVEHSLRSHIRLLGTANVKAIPGVLS